MEIRITDDKGKVNVLGSLDGGIFRSVRKGSKHLMRKYDAWGIDETVFNEVLASQAIELRILDEETNEVYKASVLDFEKHGIIDTFKPHRSQIFLARSHWVKSPRFHK